MNWALRHQRAGDMTEDEKLAQLDFADPAQLRQVLRRAMAALAEDSEGIRLWMLDCGELVAKHRARAWTQPKPSWPSYGARGGN